MRRTRATSMPRRAWSMQLNGERVPAIHPATGCLPDAGEDMRHRFRLQLLAVVTARR